MIYTQENITDFNVENRKKYHENKRFFDRLKNKKIKNLDQEFHPVHDKVFDFLVFQAVKKSFIFVIFFTIF